MSNSMGKVIHQRLKRAQLTVGIFSAQAAVLEHHLSIIDIMAQAYRPMTSQVQPSPTGHFRVFPYAMLTTPVVGIGAECLDGLCIHGGGPNGVGGARSGADDKDGVMLWRWVALLRFSVWSLVGSSCAGRLFPARYSSLLVWICTDLRGLEFEIVFKLIDVHYRVMKIDQC